MKKKIEIYRLEMLSHEQEFELNGVFYDKEEAVKQARENNFFSRVTSCLGTRGIGRPIIFQNF